MRRCFFWQTVERSRKSKDAAPSPYLMMHDFRSLMQPSESDAGWMIRDIETAENQGDRQLLLTIALRHTPRSLMAQLEQVAGTDPELSAMLREYRTGHRWAWFHRLRYRWGERRRVEALVVHATTRPEPPVGEYLRDGGGCSSTGAVCVAAPQSVRSLNYV